MSESRSGSHRYFRLPASSPLLSRALAACAVLTTVVGLSLTGSSAAMADTGGDGYNGVFLSEVFTHGADANNDTVADGDWIELFNSTSSPVDLSGAILSDSDNSHQLVIPAATSIPANSYMAFRTDAASNTGEANFSLGDTDEARLFAPDSDVATGTPADEFDWGHSPVFSWSRNFNDSMFIGDPEDVPWQASSAVTLNTSNDVSTPASDPLTGIKINEVNMNGGAHGDWIELYDNSPTGTAAVNLTGAILSDSDDTHAYVIGKQTGDTTSISPGGFATYRVDNPANNGNFGLGGSDSARLYRANTLDLFGNGTDPSVVTPVGSGAATIDSVSWSSAPAFTLGREPDGSGLVNNNAAFVPTTEATFDASNDDAGSPPTHEDLTGVVINEIKTTGDPAHGDWIELLNTGSSTVNLSQAILSDDNPSHIIRIANGTMLAPGAVLPITTDNDTDNPILTDPNVASGDFGLGDDDEARLFDADATNLAPGGSGVNAPVDSFSWTSHAATSYGRKAGEDTTNTQSSTVWGVTKNPTYNDATNDFTNDTDYTVNGTDNSGLNYIQVNEISSTDNTGDPIPADDWVELINTAPDPININGMVLSDSEDTHALTLSSTNTEVGDSCPGDSSSMGTTIPAGEFALILVDKSSYTGNFGLGSNDAIRLYAPDAVPGMSISIDHNEWTSHPTGSYQRTDNGLGDWANGAIDTQTPLEPNTGCPA